MALKADVRELFVEETARNASPSVLVPYANCGTCFHPGLRMKQSNGYHIGRKDAEVAFNDFDECAGLLALARRNPLRAVLPDRS